MTLQERLRKHPDNKSKHVMQKDGEEAADELDRLQAKIDSLMLEYCPNEMTTEQMQEWGRHQKPVKQAPPAEKAMEKKP